MRKVMFRVICVTQFRMERTTEYNVGLDFGFWGNRISGSVEYYNRLTKDLIMNKTIPVTTGYTSVTANVGSVRNTGIEF